MLIFTTVIVLGMGTIGIAALGTLIGVIVGSLVPPLISFSYGASLPIPLGESFSWGNVLTGLVYGLLVTLLFVLWPLGQAELSWRLR